MPRKNPPGLSRDTDRHGKTRWYVRRPGAPKVRIRETYGTDAFWQAYRDALARPVTATEKGPAKPAADSLRGLIVAYFGSAEFKRLDPGTQRVRRRILERLCDFRSSKGAAWGTLPYRSLQRKHIWSIRDDHADRPEAANAFIKAARQVFAWAIEADRADVNPAIDVRYLKGSPEGIRPWTEADVQQFIAHYPRGTTPFLALALMLYLVVRRSDVYAIGPQHVMGGRLRYTEFKNRNRKPKHHDIPVHPELAAIIADTPHAADAFVTTKRGRRFGSANSFGTTFKRWCKRAGLTKCSPHGLRKLGTSSLADAGATAHEMQSLTGHTTLKEVERYTRAANRKRLADAVVQKQIVPLSGGGCPTAPNHEEKVECLVPRGGAPKNQ